MARYLLSVYQPDGAPPPPEVLEPVTRRLTVLQQQMKDAGVWVFTGGLDDPGTATVLRAEDNGILTTDGPYVEGKEHLGGFTIVDVPDLDAALDWGRRMAAAIALLPVEVRPLR